MTVLDAPPARSARRSASGARPVGLRRVVASEWVKFRTLRSTLLVLAAAVVGMVAIGLVVGVNTRHITASIDPEDLAPSATLQGYYLGQLLIGALGVLFVSGEFSTGMIRSTLVAVPRRLPVLWAKLLVFVTVTVVAMEVASFAAFLVGQAVIGGSRTSLSLSDPGVLRVVAGTGLYLTLVGVIGAALGWIVRSTPGALVAYVAVVLVIPVLVRTAFGATGKHVAEYLPTVAGASFSTSVQEPPSLGHVAGLLVMLAWVVVAVVAAVISLKRRDA